MSTYIEREMAMRLKSPMKKSKKKLDPTIRPDLGFRSSTVSKVPNYQYDNGKKLDPTKEMPIMKSKINELKKRYM